MARAVRSGSAGAQSGCPEWLARTARSRRYRAEGNVAELVPVGERSRRNDARFTQPIPHQIESLSPPHAAYALDRKSTRLNSSHLVISYAVFCLKKKKKKTHDRADTD